MSMDAPDVAGVGPPGRVTGCRECWKGGARRGRHRVTEVFIVELAHTYDSFNN